MYARWFAFDAATDRARLDLDEVADVDVGGEHRAGPQPRVRTDSRSSRRPSRRSRCENGDGSRAPASTVAFLQHAMRADRRRRRPGRTAPSNTHPTSIATSAPAIERAADVDARRDRQARRPPSSQRVGLSRLDATLELPRVVRAVVLTPSAISASAATRAPRPGRAATASLTTRQSGNTRAARCRR